MLYKTHIIVPVKSISSVIVIKSDGFVSSLVLSSRGRGGGVVSREQTAPHVINIIWLGFDPLPRLLLWRNSKSLSVSDG